MRKWLKVTLACSAGFLCAALVVRFTWDELAIFCVEKWANARFVGRLSIGQMESEHGLILIRDFVWYDANGKVVIDFPRVRTKVHLQLLRGRIRLEELKVDDGILNIVSRNNAITLDQAMRIARSIPTPALQIDDLQLSNVVLRIQLEDSEYMVPDLHAQLAGATDKNNFLKLRLNYAEGIIHVPHPKKAVPFRFYGSIGGDSNERVTLRGACTIMGRSLDMSVKYIEGKRLPVILTLKPDQFLQDIISSIIEGFSEKKLPEIDVRTLENGRGDRI